MPTNDPSQAQQSYPPRQEPVQFKEEEYKASYDDLIDQYASPFARNSQHATFTLEDPSKPSAHRRGASIPLGTKPSYSSETSAKQSDDSDVGPVAYPPPLTPKETDTRSFWRKVLQPILRFRARIKSFDAVAT